MNPERLVEQTPAIFVKVDKEMRTPEKSWEGKVVKITRRTDKVWLQFVLGRTTTCPENFAGSPGRLVCRRWDDLGRTRSMGPASTASKTSETKAVMPTGTGGPTNLGILAFGSLIMTPGPEIASVTVGRIKDVKTPFKVEFARKMKARGYAPILIPVDSGGGGGAEVSAEILVMRDDVAPDLAADMLWRRGTHQTGRQRYRRPAVIGRDDVIVETIHDLAGVRTVLYTKLGPNIDRLSADTLADLAIHSVRTASPGEDGITYLMDAKRCGIELPSCMALNGRYFGRRGPGRCGTLSTSSGLESECGSRRPSYRTLLVDGEAGVQVPCDRHQGVGGHPAKTTRRCREARSR